MQKSGSGIDRPTTASIFSSFPINGDAAADLRLETGEKIRLQVGKKISAQRHGNETQRQPARGTREQFQAIRAEFASD